MGSEHKANILLVGGGGVGSMTAYALEKAGKAQVTVVCRSNYARVQKQGFDLATWDSYAGLVQGWKPSQVRNSVPDVAAEGLSPYDFIVVTTKNIADIKPGVEDIIKPAVTPAHSAIMLLQNGLNIEKPIMAAFPGNPVLSGVSTIGATETSPGCIRQDDADVLIVGAFNSLETQSPELVSTADSRAREFVNIYSAAGKGVNCQYNPDVKASRWRKLLYNAPFNSVATILRMDTSRMRVSEHVIDGLIRPAYREIEACAAAVGVVFPAELCEKILTADPYESFFKPSMCQDFEKGNFMEFESIVGEPVRVGQDLGVPTPVLSTIYELLKGLQWKIKETKGLISVPSTAAGLKYE